MKSETKYPNDYAQRIAVVNAMRKALAKVAHHEKMTKRVRDSFEKELPGYTVRISTFGSGTLFGHDEISVWGNGLSYDEAVTAAVWPRQLQEAGGSWSKAMALDLDRNDYSDIAEREKDEMKLFSALDKIEAQIAALQEKAQAFVAALPKPKSATIREWTSTGASSGLTAKYPLSFGGK